MTTVFRFALYKLLVVTVVVGSILEPVSCVVKFPVAQVFTFFWQLKLDEVQLSEQESLRQKLQSEQELLSAYQSKQSSQLKAQHEKEEKELQDKVSVRRALLEQKVQRIFRVDVYGLLRLRKWKLANTADKMRHRIWNS